MQHKKHWVVLAIACLLSSSAIGILMNTIGVFNIPVSQALGFRLGDFTVYGMLATIAMSLTSLIMPRILKRVPFRLVVLASTVVTMAASVLMGHATELWQFYILGFVRGAFMALVTMVTLTILINNWFKKKHGLMTSIVFSFGGLAGAIVSPMLEYSIQSGGWPSAYYLTAILVFVLNLPALLIRISLDPRDEGLQPYGYEEIEAEREAVQTPIVEANGNAPQPFTYFSILFLSFGVIALLNTMLSGMTPHLPAIGQTMGLTSMQGVTMLSASMIGNIVFKLVIGIISDKKGAVVANGSMMLLNLFSVALFLFTSNYYLLVFASFLFGSIFSTSAVGFAFLTRRFFPPEHFQKVTSSTTFVAGLGQAFAMNLVGRVYDLTGHFTLVFLIGIGVHLLNLTLLFVIYKQGTKGSARLS